MKCRHADRPEARSSRRSWRIDSTLATLHNFPDQPCQRSHIDLDLGAIRIHGHTRHQFEKQIGHAEIGEQMPRIIQSL